MRARRRRWLRRVSWLVFLPWADQEPHRGRGGRHVAADLDSVQRMAWRHIGHEPDQRRDGWFRHSGRFGRPRFPHSGTRSGRSQVKVNVECNTGSACGVKRNRRRVVFLHLPAFDIDFTVIREKSIGILHTYHRLGSSNEIIYSIVWFSLDLSPCRP